MSKVQITGASDWVRRMFEACGPHQWARELLKNSLEAKATQIEFGIEWQAVEKLGVYRRTIIDNGSGMNRDDLLKFFSTLGAGAKKIGGIHDNFGVGAKIATLPWNPEGVVVVSYKDGKPSMIQIVLEPQSGEYELVEFEVGGGRSAVIDPTEVNWVASNDVDWSALRPSWLTDKGTIVVLLGAEAYPDTVLGNPDESEGGIKGLAIYLNSRFWDLSNQNVVVAELRSDKKTQWPTSVDDRDDTRRPNNRRILGARHYLETLPSKDSKLAASGSLMIDEERVMVDWYLWEGKRPQVHMYARENGYIAVRYNDELFSLSVGKVQFRWFGVVESKVQQNLTIILEPQILSVENGRWGVHPEQSRNRLIFTGDGEKGVELPLHDWGFEFTENLPDEIMKAIAAVRGETTGSLDDEEYRKRLQDRFGSRWTMRQLVMTKPKAEKEQTTPAIESEAKVEVSETPVEVLDEILGVRAHSRRKRLKSIKQLVPKAYTGIDGVAVERTVQVDVPKYRFAPKEDFELPWHIAMWDELSNTVVVNQEAPVLLESVKYHQEQYADVYAEEVQKTVMDVFGEVAVAKIAHSQRLKRLVTDEELRNEYRNEKVLTIALMGLLAEESLMGQRLGKFGRKKAA